MGIEQAFPTERNVAEIQPIDHEYQVIYLLKTVHSVYQNIR